MAKPLIIVESPTKARTITKFLGGDFVVEASFGHIRDLPKSKISIDTEHDFAPTYIIPPKAKETVSKLKKLAAEASEILLATDPDREGEAIAWHLVQALGLENSKVQNSKFKKNPKSKIQKLEERANLEPATRPSAPSSGSRDNPQPATIKRIVFHEITKSAIQEALDHPREIDVNLVDAQQARRVLDRLVGYELSPFLWRKVRYGLSAGRVQSVAVRLVVEREREIEKFNKQEYWSIEALLATEHPLPTSPQNSPSLSRKAGTSPPKGEKNIEMALGEEQNQTFTARLHKIDEKTLGKLDIKSEQQAKDLVNELEKCDYKVSSIEQKEIRRNPSPPFTTSTLQQEAARKLGFSAKQTMVVAQGLYERGHITYMRTDSLNLAQSALKQAHEIITNQFGKQYALESPRFYANKSKGAQEAHEAVRPTDLGQIPAQLAHELDRNQMRLYTIIWQRTLACQMQQAIMDQTTVDIEAKSTLHTSHFTLRANGQVIKFDGFIRVYTEGKDEEDGEDEKNNKLPKLEAEERLNLEELKPEQHFTEPPPRYTDASLIKALEAAGIGRPSTYAPTLTTIQEREYVEKEEKKYKPTEIGCLVNDLLVEHFPEIVDLNFTAKIEEDLDDIAEGKAKWVPVMREFYEPFKKHLIEKEKSVEKQVEISTTPCSHCGKMMLIKFGRMGKFLACPDPESKITQPLPEEAAKIAELTEKTKNEICPICDKPMEVKRGRFGFFLGCTDYPKCKGISKIWNKTGFKCLECLDNEARKDKPGDIVEKKGRGRGKPFYACTRWPDCEFITNVKPENQEQLKELYEAWKVAPKKDASGKKAKYARKVTSKKRASKKS